jgi:hypothetical protein
MTFNEINALTVESSIMDLLPRLVNFDSVPPEEMHYSVSNDDSLSMYERLSLHASLVKPELSDFEAELVVYKQELTDAEQARLDEIARVADIIARYEAIPDIQKPFGRAGMSVTNPALEMRRIISEDDQACLAELEQHASDIAAEKAAFEAANSYIDSRKSEYPKVEELIVALWEGDQAKIDELEAARQAIKAKYPKP